MCKFYKFINEKFSKFRKKSIMKILEIFFQTSKLTNLQNYERSQKIVKF